MGRKKVVRSPNTLLVETAWEVCNQVGGIYTVVRSKIPEMVRQWDKDFFLLGPYFYDNTVSDFEYADIKNPSIHKAIEACKQKGLEIHAGQWLVSGRPQTILFNPESVMHKLGEIKYFFWEHHSIDFKNHDPLMDQVLCFGYMVLEFISELARNCVESDLDLLAHFHEYMAGTAIPEIRRAQIPVKIIFTTHATLLGRYLAMNDPHFYNNLPFVNWEEEAKNFNIESNVKLERACVHGSHVFTTVSAITGKECTYLLGRSPDYILPNGLNIDRFYVPHEVQNLHHQFKETLEKFVIGHFFQSYSFDLNKTLYFFTSGRFEYLNKGYDLTLEALAKLNWKLKNSGSDMTVVMFFITKRPTHSINPEVLNSRAVMGSIDQNCDAIIEQLRGRLFQNAASSEDHRLPSLNDMVDDYWRLRYRRTIQSWKTKQPPKVVTHNLVDDAEDPILNFLRTADLVNKKEDNVKIVYHPDFLSSTSPLIGMDYGDFVRACHLGVFPSYYEPWGYTPIECLARGVSAITSDLAGFGDYVKNVKKGNEAHGLFMVERGNKNFDESADHLANIMFEFVMKSSRARIDMRNKSEDLSEEFDWKKLYQEYLKSYEMASDKVAI